PSWQLPIAAPRNLRCTAPRAGPKPHRAPPFRVTRAARSAPPTTRERSLHTGRSGSTCRRRGGRGAGGRRGGAPTGAGPRARCRARQIPSSRDRELPERVRLVPAARPRLGGPAQDRTRAATRAPPCLETSSLPTGRRDVTNHESSRLALGADARRGVAVVDE